MASFLPLCSHKNPEKVLIVGGGDGGVAREVSKHPKVKEIVQVLNIYYKLADIHYNICVEFEKKTLISCVLRDYVLNISKII